MNFPMVPEYQFDIDGTNKENEIDNEPVPLEKSKYNKVITFRHAPFFVDSLSMTDKNGDPLIPGKHYRIFKIMGRLSSYCAKEVAAFVEIIDPTIDLCFGTYHSVGDISLFDNGLSYAIVDAINDPRVEIDYENIKNRPTSFTPKAHKHSLLYSIVSFQDTVDTIEVLMQTIKKQGPELIKIKLDAMANIVRHYIVLYGDQLRHLMEVHSGTYNEHGLDKNKINLSLTQNHGTATQKDMDEGYREDLLVTPDVLGYAINQAKFNNAAYLRANSIPFSSYGTGNYIPPSIDGSFEGIGSATECTGFCLEADDTMMLLKNQFDGRASGIYYSRIEDWRSDNPKYVFTGYKYQHQRIIADGCQPTRIVQGSNENILMLGDLQKDTWYIALTNGTFDSSKHVMSKIDMTDLLSILNAETGQTRFADEYYMGVHYFGKYTYLLLSFPGNTGGGFGQGARVYFTRALSSDIAKGGTVKFSKWKIRYQNIHGQTYTQQDYVQMFIKRTDAQGRTTANYWTYVPYATNDVLASWKPVNISSIDGGENLLRFQFYIQAQYVKDGKSLISQARPTIIYQFDPDAGYLTLVSRSPDQVINFDTMSQSDVDNIIDENTLGGQWVRPNGGYSFTEYIAPTGEMIATEVPGSGTYPVSYGVYKYQGRNTRHDMTRSVFSKLDANSKPGVPGSPIKTYAQGIIKSPLANGDTPSVMVYDNSNELMNGHLPPGRKGVSPLYYRFVEGGYENREGIFNVNFPVKSRPLTNNVLETNVSQTTTTINYSGSQSDLAVSSVSMGQHTFSVGHSVNGVGFPSDIIKNVAWDTKHEGSAMSFPNRSHFEKMVSETGTTMELKIDSWYGLTQNAINKMEELLPKENPNEMRTASIMIIDDAGGIYKGAVFGLVSVTCDRLNHDYYDTQLFLVALNWEEPNSSHPTTRMVTDLTAISYCPIQQLPSSLHTPVPEQPYGSRVGSLQVYKNGNTLYCGLYGPMLVYITGNSVTGSYMFRVDLSSFALTMDNFEVASWYAIGSGRTYQTIPWVGIAENLYGTESGFAALTAVKDGQHFLMASIYPETGWIVYFQTQIKVSFSGTEHVIEPGSMDLRDLPEPYINRTLYIYVRLRNGIAEYYITANKVPNTTFNMWIGTIVTNDKQILSINRQNVFLVNGNLISEEKRGSAIPASAGLINERGQFAWIKDSELI